MDLADLSQTYARDGCLRVPGLLDAGALAEVRRELDRYTREVVPGLPEGDRTFEADGKAVRNLWRMERHSAFFDRIARDPRVLGLVRVLVRGEPVLMGVETFSKPAKVGSAVPPHQDNAYFCQSPPDALTVWIALDPATEANGPVLYLKGSHRGGTRPHRPSGVAGNSMGLVSLPDHDPADVFRGTLEPGDALIHHCEAIHWSEPNRSDRPRCGLLLVYRGEHAAQDPALKAAYDAARAVPA